MGPEFITEAEAVTALETPQILLAWSFDSDLTSPLSGIPWLWDNMVVRRSKHRFPEDETDGDSVLSEAYSNFPTTNLSDTNIDYYSISYIILKNPIIFYVCRKSLLIHLMN